MYVSQLNFMDALDVLAARDATPPSPPPPPPSRDAFTRWLDAAGFDRRRMSPRQFDAVVNLFVAAHPGETVEGVTADADRAELWRGITCDAGAANETVTPTRRAA